MEGVVSLKLNQKFPLWSYTNLLLFSLWIHNYFLYWFCKLWIRCWVTSCWWSDTSTWQYCELMFWICQRNNIHLKTRNLDSPCWPICTSFLLIRTVGSSENPGAPPGTTGLMHSMATGNLNKSMETKPMTFNTLVVVGMVFLLSFRLPMTILWHTTTYRLWSNCTQ